MAKTITAAELFEDVEVDLWGAKFRLREGTREVQIQLVEAQKRLEELPEDDPDLAVEALTKVLDVLLEPLGDEDGKKVKAQTVIGRKWKANEVGLDRIAAIAEGIQSASEDRARPPSSAAMNGG